MLFWVRMKGGIISSFLDLIVASLCDLFCLWMPPPWLELMTDLVLHHSFCISFQPCLKRCFYVIKYDQLRSWKKISMVQQQIRFLQRKNLYYLTEYFLLTMKPGATYAMIWWELLVAMRNVVVSFVICHTYWTWYQISINSFEESDSVNCFL